MATAISPAAALGVGIDIATVLRAVRVAARGKRAKPDVAAFLLDAERNALAIAIVRELRAGTWRPSTPRAFLIREPKLRLISALPFRDRVVQHLLIAATLPAIERSFAPQSYACRAGFGTHRCLRVAADLSRGHRYVLRLDIAKFFPSIDHAVIKRMLHPRWRMIGAPAAAAVRDGCATADPQRRCDGSVDLELEAVGPGRTACVERLHGRADTNVDGARQQEPHAERPARAQQICYRYAKGITTYARFAQFIFAVRLLAEQARTSIERKAN